MHASEKQTAQGSATRAQPRESNWLLRRASPADYAWLVSTSERVTLGVGQILAEPGQPYDHVFFPDTCVLSLVARAREGGSIEAGTVGKEGMAGLSVFLDAGAMPGTTMMTQVGGTADRIAAGLFADGVAQRPGLQRLLRRYTHAFLAQVAQTVVCNRMHPL